MCKGLYLTSLFGRSLLEKSLYPSFVGPLDVTDHRLGGYHIISSNYLRLVESFAKLTWLNLAQRCESSLGCTTSQRCLISKNSVCHRYNPTSQAELRYRNLMSCRKAEALCGGKSVTASALSEVASKGCAIAVAVKSCVTSRSVIAEVVCKVTLP
jgi:hypothetical protein